MSMLHVHAALIGRLGLLNLAIR